MEELNIQEYKGFKGRFPKNKDRTSSSKFSKINIVYGENGSGKSTFSEYLKENYDAIVFNRNYIKDNILLEDDKFKGIKLSAGKDNINLVEEIKKMKIDKKKKKI